MDDLIRRTDAIRVASGYCHWSNIPDELAKLPSVNPIPCEDAISRQEALDAFGLSEKTRKYGGDHSGYDPMMLYEIQGVIENLPSVSTEKTGRWIEQKDVNGNIYYDCSECDGGAIGKYEYCPFCGARMREVGETD